MQKNIHPTYYPNATIKCACGNVITTGATKEKLFIELCSACHPFYTGTQKLIDTAKRVDKFEERRKKAREMQERTLKEKEKKQEIKEKPIKKKTESKKTSVKQKKTAGKKKEIRTKKKKQKQE